MPQTKEQFRTTSLHYTTANVLECMTEEYEEELVQSQSDPSEGATGPSPSCTWPPLPPAAPGTNQGPHREETPSDRCPSPSFRMTCGSTTLQTATVSEDWTT